jgi:hypothetical protein
LGRFYQQDSILSLQLNHLLHLLSKNP